MISEPVSSRPRSAAVLLVDDTAANLLALGAVVGPIGVRMVTAQTPEEALDHVRREPFAVALIDVQMPGMDGFELTWRLRQLEHGRDLPVVFVTAIYQDEHYIRKGYETGAADYITKPYDPDVVRARVKAFVGLYEQRESVRRAQVAQRTQERDQAIRRLVAFERISSTALDTGDVRALLDELLHAFTEAADTADSATVLLRDGDWLEIKASVGLSATVDEEGGVFRLPLGVGFAGTIASNRTPLELSETSIASLAESRWLKARGVRGLYGVPLLHAGAVLGVAHMGSTRTTAFSEGEKRLFRTAADRAALAVARQLELSSLYEILRAAPAAIAIVRVPGLEYAFANPAYRALVPGELDGHSLRERSICFEALETVLEVSDTGTPIDVAEMQVRHSSGENGENGENGEPSYVRFTAQAMRSATGSIDRVLMFAMDVTQQVIARKEIEATQAARSALLERERAARVSAEAASIAKDEFLATVSHELRTPLNAILGWASMARAKAVPDMNHAMNVIERNARAQARIVEDVLDYARIAQGKLRLNLARVDVETVIRDAMETVRPAAEAKNIELVTDARLTGKFVCDPQRLQQVVWNLLTNAIKFSRSAGRVVLRAESRGEVLRIEVIDEGQGIEPDFVPHVFDAFRQASGGTTRRHGGLGLGLAIVKQIVQAHGGTIQAWSAGLGEGATFTVELPGDARSADTSQRITPVSAANAPALIAPARLDGLKLLVVDDDEDSREFLARALEQCGATVLPCNGVAEALRALEHFRPDVLVSDIAMPGADGYDLIRRIRSLPEELGGQVPAIAVTAHTRTQVRGLAVEAGFHLLEAKPVDIERLSKAISGLASRSTSET